MPAAADTALRRWQQLSRWLDEALDRDGEQRAAWLAALHAQQPPWPADWLDELARLLAAHAQADGDTRLRALPALGPVAASAAAPAAGPRPGQRIGPWVLLEPLGEGGMASVWLARRDDGAYAREVALKLPRQLPWRDDLAQRLARERDILARLDHPHIARLYDAGLADGHPWLAMQRVDGQPIDAWCDAHRSSLRGRVHLFMQVLDAMSHAHGQLVLHRDLKPANILVDAQRRVHVLDFGIAKLLQPEDQLTRETQLTAFAGRAMTPDYASPEQVRGEPLSAASDVYSLGVILYELLCGEPPYRLQHRSAAQLESAVLEAVPARPSSRPGEAGAQARRLRARTLARALRGPLDAIVLKALKKAPAARYGSAGEFRADLQRWLDGLPVQAQPDSLATRGAAFVRRHGVGVALGAALAVAMLAATAFSWQQARLAEREALRAQATRDFLLGLYKPVSWLGGNPAHGGQVTARELLDLSAQRLREHPAADADVQRDLLDTLHQLYADAGSQPDRLRIAQALEQHTSRHQGEASAAHFDALVKLATAQFESDGRQAALTLARAAALRQRLRMDDAESDVRYWMIQAQLTEESDVPASERAFGEAVRIARSGHGSGQLLGESLAGLARLRGDAQGRLDEAARLYDEALAALRSAPDTPAYALTQPEVELAELLARQGRYGRARALLQTAYQRGLRGLGPAHVDTVQTGMRLAELMRNTGDAPASLQLLQQLHQTWAALPPSADDVLTLPNLLRHQALSEAALGRWQPAVQHAAQALAGLDRRYGDRPTVTRAVWAGELARSLASAGDAGEAERLLAQARAAASRSTLTPKAEQSLAATAAVLAVLRVHDARSHEDALAALDLWQQGLLKRQAMSTDAPTLTERQWAQAEVWRAQAALFAGHADAAWAAARRASARLQALGRDEAWSGDEAEARAWAAIALQRQGRHAEACAEARDAFQTLERRLPGSAIHRLLQAPALRCPGMAGSGRPRQADAPWSPAWSTLRQALDAG